MNNVLDLGSTSDLDYILNRLLSKASHQVGTWDNRILTWLQELL